MLDPGAGESEGVATTPRIMINRYISYYFLSYQRQSFFEDCYQIFVVQKGLILQVLFTVFFSSRERDPVVGRTLLPHTVPPLALLALVLILKPIANKEKAQSAWYHSPNTEILHILCQLSTVPLSLNRVHST